MYAGKINWVAYEVGGKCRLQLVLVQWQLFMQSVQQLVHGAIAFKTVI